MKFIKACFVFLITILVLGVSTTHGYVQVPKKKFEVSTGFLKGKDPKDYGLGLGLGYGLTDYLQLEFGYSHYNNNYEQSYTYKFQDFRYSFTTQKDQKINTFSLGLTGRVNLPFSALRINGSRFMAASDAAGNSETLEGFGLGTQFLLGRDWKVKPYIAKQWAFYSSKSVQDNSAMSYGVYIEAAKNLNIVADYTDSDGVGITSFGVMFYH